jgi:cytochrome c oxidase subunit 2
MKTQSLLAGALLLIVVPLAAAVTLDTEVPAATDRPAISQDKPEIREIELKAKKYQFTPNKIAVALNETVRFKITAEDAEHGFEIQGVKDSCVEIKKGETATVTYTAAKAGTFEFKCCHFCGLGHGRMKGSIVVK